VSAFLEIKAVSRNGHYKRRIAKSQSVSAPWLREGNPNIFMKNLSFWREFSISKRLVGSFGIAALYTLLASGLGIFTFVQSTQSLKAITTDYLPYLTSAHELAISARAISARSLDLINSRNQSTRQSVVDQIDDEFQLMIALVEELAPSGIESLSTVIITKQNLRDGYQRLNALVEKQVVRQKKNAELQRVLTRLATKRNVYFNSFMKIDVDGVEIKLPPDLDKLDLLTRSLSMTLSSTLSLTKIAQLTYFQADAQQSFAEIALTIDSLPTSELKTNILSLLSRWRSLATDGENIFALRKAQIQGTESIGLRAKVYARDSKWLVAAAHAVIGEVQSSVNKSSEKIVSQLQFNGIGLMLIAFLCVLSAVLLALRIGKNIGTRIEVLQHSMELHAQGKQVEVPLEGNDEIGKMATALRVFISSMKQRESELKSTHADLYSNLSELELAQRALVFSEQRFKDFAGVSADWFWEMDTDLRFIHVQGGTLDALGISPEKLLNQSLKELLSEQHYAPISPYLLNKVAFESVELSWPLDNHKLIYFHVSGKPLFNANGDFDGFRGTGSDITQAHELSEKLFYQASHDSLTGLVNRNAFEQYLQKVVDRSACNSVDHIIFYIDLDHFKVVNDSCGHLAGDQLLKNISKLLKDNVRKYDVVARLGGDEFAIVLETCSRERATVIANKLLQAISAYRFVWEGQNFCIGASIGLVLFSGLSNDINEILKVADAACYAAKNSGRNCVHVHR
jgi:diguanylate cyclase (GGDEF)-like protein/PAS domain S-box-containing protein